MLESMIEKHGRYAKRVKLTREKRGGMEEEEDEEEETNGKGIEAIDQQEEHDKESSVEMEKKRDDFEEWINKSWTSNDLKQKSDDNQNNNDILHPSPQRLPPHWYEPRPNELTFPPNTINYNSVLNAWGRASRYDPYAAVRAESMLLDRMEFKEGGMK